MRKKVLFVINSLHGGGAERVMALLLAHSEARACEHDVSIALLDRDAIAFPPPQWVRLHQLDCRFRTISSCVQLRRLVAKERPDITVSFLTRANVASGFAMAGRRRSWLISERTNTAAHSAPGLRGWLTRAIVRAIYPLATKVIAVSSGVACTLEHAFGVAPDRIEVIANPVDSPELRSASGGSVPIAVDGPYVIALGRLAPVKNYPLLVRAFARSGIAGRLVIAGEGPDAARLRQLASELGIGDRLVLAGFLANPYPLLRGASAFASSSNAEGFPNAVLEALALGVPVVATNCRDGPAEILANKRAEDSRGVEIADAGILTPVGDVDAFARALRMIHREPLRSKLIANGVKRASAYSPAAAVDRYWAVIETALRQQPEICRP